MTIYPKTNIDALLEAANDYYNLCSDAEDSRDEVRHAVHSAAASLLAIARMMEDERDEKRKRQHNDPIIFGPPPMPRETTD